MTFFASYLSLFLNQTIILDLRQVISNPFVASEKRVKKYVAVSVLLSLFFCLINLALTTSKNQRVSAWSLRIYQLVALVNCSLATYTVVWLTIRFRKPGMSGDLKNEIRQRYIEYVVLYAIFSWPICIVNKPYYRYIPSVNSYIGGTRYITQWYKQVVLFSGTIIALSRLRDKYVWKKVRRMVSCCGSSTKAAQDESKDETSLNTFLATSLNTELVLCILKGITILAASSSDNVDNMNEQDMLKIKQSATIEIDQIKINNAHMWEIGMKKQKDTDINEMGVGFDSDGEEGGIQVISNEEERTTGEGRFSLNGLREMFARNSIDDINDFGAGLDQDKSTTLDGCVIQAFSTSIFQRIRLLDSINYKQILKSLNPNKNRD